MIRTLIPFAMGCLLVASVAGQDASSPSDSQTPQFESLFNGKDLAGWHGDDRFWRVEAGVLIGETTADNEAPHNTFLIHDGNFGDFELRFSYQVTGFNSGVQYRSVELDDFVVKGYQADFEAEWHDDGTVDNFSGMFFEENGRMFMGQRGDVVLVDDPPAGETKPVIRKIGSVGDPKELGSVIKRDGWNEYVVIARGFQFIHIINGRVMSIGIDEDETNRRADGVIAFQLHSGPAMQIKVKDMRIREF